MSSLNVEYHIARLMALVPTLLVLLIGMVLAIRGLPKFPRACWFLLAAIVTDGLANLGLPIVMQSVMQFLSLNNLNAGQNQIVWSFLWQLPFSLTNAVIWILVYCAVFDRPTPPKFLREDDPDRDILDR